METGEYTAKSYVGGNRVWADVEVFVVAPCNAHPTQTCVRLGAICYSVNDFRDYKMKESQSWRRASSTAHEKDEDCAGQIDPETDCCRTCGVGHLHPCAACRGTGYHRPGCNMVGVQS